MYGKIGHTKDWDEQSDDFRSNLFYHDTLKELQEVAREHHPILQTIQNRERDAQNLSSSNPYTLENQLKTECQENGEDTEWANRLRAAIGWRENADEIKKLQEELQEARNAMYRARKGESDEEKETYTQNRYKSLEAERSLESTKRHAIEEYTEWSWRKDYYDFRSDFENFLSDIASHHKSFREFPYDDEQIKELIQKYFENPSWHVPQITNFLLTDLVDSDLIRLERDFQFGLFSDDITDRLGLRGIPPRILTLPTLSREFKIKSRTHWWALQKLLIGGVLILSSAIFREDLDKLEISMGFPSWRFPEMLAVIGLLFLLPLLHCLLSPLLQALYLIVGQQIDRLRIPYKRWQWQANILLNIRWDITTGIYDAQTFIEKLKRIDDELHISSLVYPLLELQKRR